MQAKLSQQEVSEIYLLVDEHSLGDVANGDGALNLELCNDAADSDIILTKIGMRKRLERHVSWNIAVCMDSISLITPDLRLSFHRNKKQSYVLNG